MGGLSSDLISQFVKATSDNKKRPTASTVYGTAAEQDGYVQLDGSSVLTPVISTVKMKPGERVVVQIKDHVATVTGNLTTQSARGDDVDDIIDKIAEFEIVIADKVSTSELEAVHARIDTITAGTVTTEHLEAVNARIDDLEADNVTITGTLTALEAEITTLSTEKLDAEFAEMTYATIENLEATNLQVNNLEATYGDFVDLTTERLDAHDAVIENLDAEYAAIEDLEAERARIDILEASSLTADSAVIKNLQSDVADIDTLIFGSASGDTIQTSFANAVIAQLGNAQIKAAMIENVTAGQITAGDIITNNVRVLSEDGKLLISDETIQISDETRVRVQIGKDSEGDYSINIWDADGNLMFSEGGITDSAIKDAIIRDDMVSETANISASKININSLFEEINGSTNTIKASQIFLDDEQQILEIAFTSLIKDIEDLDGTVSSQGTRLSVVEGQIATKIWQQDIDTATDELGREIDTLNTQYSALEQEVNGISATVASHTSQIANKADESSVTEVRDQVSKLEVTVGGIQTRVTETEASVSDIESRVRIAETAIAQNATDIELRATKTEVTKTLEGYYTSEETDAAIKLASDSVTSTVRNTYATKQEVEDIEVGGRNLAIGTSDQWVDITITAWSGQLWHTAGGVANYVHAFSDYGISAGDWITFAVDLNAINKPIAIRVDCHNADSSASNHRYGNYIDVGETGRSSITLQASEDLPYFYVYVGSDGSVSSNTIEQYKCLKIEKGNKATDWTPAPEDMATAEDVENAKTSADVAQTTASDAESRVSVAESTIQQLADMISTLVTDGNGVSLMTQTENGWTFSTAAIQESVENTAEGLGELTENLGSVEAAVDALDSAVQDLGVIAEYIHIGTYSYTDTDGNEQTVPSIDLGETDSEFKLKITNRRIVFTNGAEVIVRIDSETNSLHIGKAVIESELQIGEFVWTKRANGNVGLMWKGVTE